jgi:anti-sigma regulatory factor (Ser/Thr protein kinase)
MSAIIRNGKIAAVDEYSGALESDPVIVRKEFTFPGDVQSVGTSRERVMQYIREYCNDEADEIDLTIALQEALANAALHGCGDDAGKVIHCIVELQPSTISCVVRDPGSGFDFERIADPNRFDTTTLEHGRGLALMRSLVDEVTFSHSGSEVRFSKRMNCRVASSAL